MATTSVTSVDAVPLRYSALSALSAQSDVPGRAIYVIDGDSLSCSIQGKPSRVRLYGIDAPERGQSFASQARQRLADLVLERPLRLQLRGKDRYQRQLAQILLPDGRDAGQEMVRAGLAWWYRQYAPEDKNLAAYEREARAELRGLWAQARPVAPWDYRKQRR